MILARKSTIIESISIFEPFFKFEFDLYFCCSLEQYLSTVELIFALDSTQLYPYLRHITDSRNILAYGIYLFSLCSIHMHTHTHKYKHLNITFKLFYYFLSLTHTYTHFSFSPNKQLRIQVVINIYACTHKYFLFLSQHTCTQYLCIILF